MMSKSFRDPASRWHDIDIDVAVVFSGESDQSPIWRKHGIGLFSAPACQEPSLASLARHDPKISGKRKGNRGLRERGLLEKEWSARLRRVNLQQDKQQRERVKEESLHRSPWAASRVPLAAIEATRPVPDRLLEPSTLLNSSPAFQVQPSTENRTAARKVPHAPVKTRECEPRRFFLSQKTR